jgi:hypothetical protein
LWRGYKMKASPANEFNDTDLRRACACPIGIATTSGSDTARCESR